MRVVTKFNVTKFEFALYLTAEAKTPKSVFNHSELDQGPLITDGRNSNEMWFSKISFCRMTLAFQK